MTKQAAIASFSAFCNLSPNYIYCQNPEDLGPPADILLKAIKDKQRQMANNCDTRPLVVLFGEKHPSTAHKALLKAVLSRLIVEGQDFELRHEICHNFGAKITENHFNIFTEDSLHNHWHKLDHNFIAARHCALATLNQNNIAAASSFLDLINFSLKHNINTIFNDAAKGRKSLDLSDMLTANATETCNFHEALKYNLKISATETSGVKIRNKVMASFKTGKKLVIQIAGSAHIAGINAHKLKGFNASNNSPFEDSLIKTYQKAGFATLPALISVPSKSFGIGCVPEQSYQDLKNGIFIDNLSEKDTTHLENEGMSEQDYITKSLCDSTASKEVDSIRREFTDILKIQENLQSPAYEEITRIIDLHAIKKQNHNKPKNF